MATKKTIYVKDNDLPLWERFEKIVKDGGAADSTSDLVAQAMRTYLDQFGYYSGPTGRILVLAPDQEDQALSEDQAAAYLTRAASRPGDWRVVTLPDGDDYELAGYNARISDLVDDARAWLGKRTVVAQSTAVVPEGPHEPRQEFTARDLLDLYERVVATEDYLVGASTKEEWLTILRRAGSSAPDEAEALQAQSV